MDLSRQRSSIEVPMKAIGGLSASRHPVCVASHGVGEVIGGVEVILDCDIVYAVQKQSRLNKQVIGKQLYKVRRTMTFVSRIAICSEAVRPASQNTQAVTFGDGGYGSPLRLCVSSLVQDLVLYVGTYVPAAPLTFSINVPF